MRTTAWFDEFSANLKYGLRQLASSPAMTITSVATLALAIAATTTMFSVVNAVLLRPLPYRSPEQLAMLWIGSDGRPAYRTVEEWHRRSQLFSDMAIHDGGTATLSGPGGARRISVAGTSPNFLPLLGVRPLHGRLFSDEDAEARRRVVVIGHRFWQSRFGGSPNAIGASIVLDDRAAEIIGILPPDADTPPFGSEIWQPHTLFPDWDARRVARSGGPWLVVSRLGRGATFEQARSEMTTIAAALDAQLPAPERNRGISVVPLSHYMVDSQSRLALWTLTGAVLCVLGIAAANVACLTLVRGAARGREIATRISLGAGPARIVRQLMAESVTLAAVSGVLGTVLAAGGVRLARMLGPADLARLNEAGLDRSELGWVVGVSLLTGLLVGLAPALTTARRYAHVTPAERGRGASHSAARRTRRILVVGEFAVAIVLLAGAGLLVRSWSSVTRLEPGFEPQRVLSLQVSTTAFDTPRRRADFYRRVVDQIQGLPGVENAGVIGDLFISNDAERLVTAEGSTGVTSQRLRLRMDEASDGFFDTVGTPLLRGRLFTPQDGPDAPRVAIVNEAMARRVWPDSDPVGRRFKFGPREADTPWFVVVGIVADMRRQGLEADPIPQIFEPIAQNPSRLATVLVRTSTDEPLTTSAAVQAAVARVDTNVPTYGIATLESQLGSYLSQRRFQTSLLIGFAAVALLLAGIGIYGTVHYSVASRTREIGIRMAVGARRVDVLHLIMREGLQLTAVGLALGLLGALWAGRAASALLYEVTATDPLTFATVSCLLAAVSAAACYAPARRAMKVEPVVALRQS